MPVGTLNPAFVKLASFPAFHTSSFWSVKNWRCKSPGNEAIHRLKCLNWDVGMWHWSVSSVVCMCVMLTGFFVWYYQCEGTSVRVPVWGLWKAWAQCADRSAQTGSRNSDKNGDIVQEKFLSRAQIVKHGQVKVEVTVQNVREWKCEGVWGGGGKAMWGVRELHCRYEGVQAQRANFSYWNSEVYSLAHE